MVATMFYALTVAGLALYALQTRAVLSFIQARRRGAAGSYMPPVSILKPLKGLDDNLFDNLESCCVQDYPEYEVIFALRDTDDPAYKVARKVKDKYPEKDISIVAEWCEEGLNPKVDTLVPAYRLSKHGIFLISDSNVHVGPDYLRETVSHMEDPKVGLVSNLIRGTGGRTLGSVFENLHLNTFIMGGVCFLDRMLRMPCVVGKSMLVRKTYFEELGGFGSVRDFLAEDYILGREMNKIARVALSSYTIDTINETWSLRQFMARHARWGKLRWRIGGLTYLTEQAFNPVLTSSVPLFLAGPSMLALAVPLAVWSIKILGDYRTGRAIGSDMRASLYLFCPVKEILVAMIWFVPIFSNTVEWRGDRYVIGKDSRLYPYREAGEESVAAY